MGKYHLPDGETLVEDLQCLVVYTPDDPVYRQALWGAISQLTKFWMWEPDGNGGEYDAADSWDLAYAATLESFNMLQQLLDAVDDVEDLLRALQTIQNAGAPCCEHLAPDNEDHAYDDSVYPDTPPSTWGDGEPIADSSDWEELVCGAAHAYVDHLKGMAQQLDELVGAGAIVVGTVAGILGLLSGAGIILAVGYGSAAGVVTGLLAGATEAVFGDVPADIEDARQDIVCEIVHGSSAGLSSAVEAAISTLAWDLFYSFVDYGSARNIMLEGSHGSEFLGVNRRTDCECAPTSEFEASWPPFDGTNYSVTAGVGGSDAFCAGVPDYLKMNPTASGANDVARIAWSLGDLVNEAGATLDPEPTDDFIDFVTLHYELGSSWDGQGVELEIFFEDSTSEVHQLANTPGQHEATITPTRKSVPRSSATCVRFSVLNTADSDIDKQCCLSLATIGFTSDPG